MMFDFWALVALAALGGWVATLFVVTKSIVPHANALATLGRLDAHIDDRLRAILEKSGRRTHVPVVPGKASTPTSPSREGEAPSALDAVREIFGGTDPIIEQPDAVEIVEP